MNNRQFDIPLNIKYRKRYKDNEILQTLKMLSLSSFFCVWNIITKITNCCLPYKWEINSIKESENERIPWVKYIDFPGVMESLCFKRNIILINNGIVFQ